MKRHFAPLLLLPLITFALGWSIAPRAAIAPEVPTIQTDRPNLDSFWTVWETIGKKYVDGAALADPKNAVYGATKGLVRSLNDPFSLFMTPKESKEFSDDLRGNLEGIGAELTMKNDLPTVVSPIKNSPAANAGILPADIIVSVNGNETAGLTLAEIIAKIRGPKGTSVLLEIARQGATEFQKISVVRDEIHIPSVEGRTENGIAIIAINQFGDETVPEFFELLQTLLKTEPKGIVLDLRFNGGGYLEGAVEIASAFLQKGSEVVTVKERDQAKNEKLTTDAEPIAPTLPMIVLINGGTASASEILAGALQDHKRAIILGEKSFGKGTVQEVLGLPDGSALRITVARWFTPSGRSVTDDKILPDQTVPRTTEDFEKNRDPQFDAAIKTVLAEKK